MNTISAPEGDSVISQILAAYELPGTIPVSYTHLTLPTILRV